MLTLTTAEARTVYATALKNKIIALAVRHAYLMMYGMYDEAEKAYEDLLEAQAIKFLLDHYELYASS